MLKEFLPIRIKAASVSTCNKYNALLDVTVLTDNLTAKFLEFFKLILRTKQVGAICYDNDLLTYGKMPIRICSTREYRTFIIIIIIIIIINNSNLAPCLIF